MDSCLKRGYLRRSKEKEIGEGGEGREYRRVMGRKR
jgi:hypothetical protein